MDLEILNLNWKIDKIYVYKINAFTKHLNYDLCLSEIIDKIFNLLKSIQWVLTSRIIAIQRRKNLEVLKYVDYNSPAIPKI